MIFNTVSYLVFLCAAVGVYWALPPRHRVWFLLGASIVFYGLWRPEFVLLIGFSAWVDFYFSLRIHAAGSPARRRLFLVCSLATNLALLLYFKYAYFVAENFEGLSALLGHPVRIELGKIVLPLGISFYTFLSVSYTVDVYRRVFEPVRSFPLYLTYVMFWPHMIAGPILRAKELLPQLSASHPARAQDFAYGIRYVLLGLFLKCVLADNISPQVDAAFRTPAAMLGGADVLTMAFAFGYQIYFDFAGYSMIAIGSARLLGIRFPENFDWPYLATSPREFWKRWHITLSSWIRDYLYLPLCGSRFRDRSEGGLEVATPEDRSHPVRIYVALFLTWFLMGLWHGASWRFAFWGLWHATFIAAYRLFSRLSLPMPDRVRRVAGWGVTLIVVMLGWIPFRAPDMATSIELLSRVLDPRGYFRLSFRENFYLIAFAILVGMLLLRWATTRETSRRRAPWFALADVAGMAVVMFLVFIFLRPISQFIYFQF